MVRLLLPLLLLALGLAGPAAAQGVEARRAAVQATLERAPACAQLGDAYWEIGDRNGRLAAGQRGGGITADQPILIASASKWLWGAYVAERQNGAPTAADIAALTMSSGYTGLNPLRCQGRVADCRGDGRDMTKSGRFYYDGGHAQQQATSFGLGTLDGPALAVEMRRLLGSDLQFTFRSPQPAGGVIMAPAAYGQFLRKLVAGQLKLSGLLGSHAVCTLPGECRTALKSPFGRNWHYSLHHWVEDAAGDDGAVSSAGAFGFYPWISADRALWGILARKDSHARAGQASAICGALLRKAWLAGAEQTGGATPVAAAQRGHPVRDALRQRMLDRGR
ncbi:MAG: hypothetical protein ACM3Q1_14560 [Bacteroidales bacterium]